MKKQLIAILLLAGLASNSIIIPAPKAFEKIKKLWDCGPAGPKTAKCTKEDRIESRNWLIGTSVAVLTTVLAAIGIVSVYKIKKAKQEAVDLSSIELTPEQKAATQAEYDKKKKEEKEAKQRKEEEQREKEEEQKREEERKKKEEAEQKQREQAEQKEREEEQKREEEWEKREKRLKEEQKFINKLEAEQAKKFLKKSLNKILPLSKKALEDYKKMSLLIKDGSINRAKKDQDNGRIAYKKIHDVFITISIGARQESIIKMKTHELGDIYWEPIKKLEYLENKQAVVTSLKATLTQIKTNFRKILEILKIVLDQYQNKMDDSLKDRVLADYKYIQDLLEVVIRSFGGWLH